MCSINDTNAIIKRKIDICVDGYVLSDCIPEGYSYIEIKNRLFFKSGIALEFVIQNGKSIVINAYGPFKFVNYHKSGKYNKVTKRYLFSSEYNSINGGEYSKVNIKIMSSSVDMGVEKLSEINFFMPGEVLEKCNSEHMLGGVIKNKKNKKRSKRLTKKQRKTLKKRKRTKT